jgi:hypothetical protein
VTHSAKKFRAGDVLKVEVTMRHGNIKFFCNDVLQGEGRGVQQGMVPYVAFVRNHGDQWGRPGLAKGGQATLLSFTS